MHEIRSSNLTSDLIERIFRDKHLEGLFLDYLRISSSALDLMEKPMHLTPLRRFTLTTVYA